MTTLECGNGSEEHTPGDDLACREERIVVAVGQRLSARLERLEDLMASGVDEAIRATVRETRAALGDPR